MRKAQDRWRVSAPGQHTADFLLPSQKEAIENASEGGQPPVRGRPRDDRRRTARSSAQAVPPALSHPRECDLVVRVALDDKRALSRRAPNRLADVISEQMTMFVSPVKQEPLKVALPWVNRTLPAQRLANTWRFPPPKGITPIDAGTCNRSIGAGGC